MVISKENGHGQHLKELTNFNKVGKKGKRIARRLQADKHDTRAKESEFMKLLKEWMEALEYQTYVKWMLHDWNLGWSFISFGIH